MSVETLQEIEVIKLNGPLIRRLRKALRLSRSKLCQEIQDATRGKVKLDAFQLGRIEKDAFQRPGPDVHYGLSLVLNVRMEDLLVGLMEKAS